MIIRDYKHLIELQHIHMEQMFFKVCESEMLSKTNVKKTLVTLQRINDKF